MSRKQLTLGLFGFGCVGSGLYDVLKSTPALQASIKRICVKDRNKQRSLPEEAFTFDAYELLDDPEINVIVELIDDADAAWEIVSYALKKGKAVVSANKKLIAGRFEELLTLQKQYNVPFLYEAAACASIPIIRNLEEYYNNDTLRSVQGIVNGSTNYILSRICAENRPYGEVLDEARRNGFAESDPTLDVKGLDARNKLCILAAHAFGLAVPPEEVFTYGIDTIQPQDAQYAAEKGYKIKLQAHLHRHGRQLGLWVLPQLVPQSEPFYNIENEYNAVQVEGVFSDRQFFSGKGAGSYPTASAVLSDLSALSYDYRYEYKKLTGNAGATALHHHPDVELELYCRFPLEIDSASLPFLHIEESFRSRHFRYVTGRASLSSIRRSPLFSHPGVFFAQAGTQVHFAEPLPRRRKATPALAGC